MSDKPDISLERFVQYLSSRSDNWSCMARVPTHCAVANFVRLVSGSGCNVGFQYITSIDSPIEPIVTESWIVNFIKGLDNRYDFRLVYAQDCLDLLKEQHDHINISANIGPTAV